MLLRDGGSILLVFASAETLVEVPVCSVCESEVVLEVPSELPAVKTSRLDSSLLTQSTYVSST